MNKKSITPIVSIILLLLFVVITFFILNDWFTNFNSSFFTSLENSSSTFLNLYNLEGNYLYINSSENINITNLRIFDNNGFLKCDLTNIQINKGDNIQNISSCNLVQSKPYYFLGYGSNNIYFQKNLILK